METAAPALVQALADASISHLPAQYVQPPEYRPATSSSHGAAALYVPVVDLSSASAANAVRAACADWGAFHVVGHGVPGELLDAMRRAGLAFFRAPMEGKFRFACDPARGAAAEGFGHTAAVCSPMTTPCSIGATTSTITLCRSPDATPPSGRISSLVTDLALGLQSHSDMGAVTLLIQDDVGGLEVMKDGMWIPVPPLPDAILVILADQTEPFSP